MKLTVILVGLFIASAANADLGPTPRTGFISTPVNNTVTASGLYNLMDVQEIRLRGGQSSAKVLRAKNELSEMVCIKTIQLIQPATRPSERLSATYACQIKISTNGRVVPAFIAYLRQG